jgi:UDP-N-acetylmuramoyl-tripeptide--D-alanyl-D-alanine ligase
MATPTPARGFNNHVGVPLTLANLPIETDFAVVEIGMNHGGRLCP